MDEQDHKRDDMLGEFRRRLEDQRRNAPKTLTEAVARLLSTLSDEDKKLVAEVPEKDLDQFHMTWGMGMRNTWIWGNEELLNNCGSMHPDEVSAVIVRAVWNAANRKREPN